MSLISIFKRINKKSTVYTHDWKWQRQQLLEKNILEHTSSAIDFGLMYTLFFSYLTEGAHSL